MKRIKVFLADDHTILREGLRSILEAEDGFEVVGEAEDGLEALERVEQTCPDVVLMDISMPRLNGLEATRQLKKLCPGTKVLVLTVHANEEYVYQVLQAGASGYLVKHAAVTELLSAIRAVNRGDSFLSPSISKTVIDEYIRSAETTVSGDSYDTLTFREREILQLVAEGHSSREISEMLAIGVKTVEAHRASLRDKLSLGNVAELTVYAIRRGVIEPDK